MQLITLLSAISVFIFSIAVSAHAATSVNVPVGSRIYDDIELLELKGLVSSAMLSSKPFGRAEAARIASEAREGFSALSPEERAREKDAVEALGRLERALADELSGERAGTYLKPDRAYAKLLYSDKDPYFENINNNGSLFRDGANLRIGGALRGAALDTVSIYLNPELRGDRDDLRGRLLTGYLTLDVSGVRVLVGRDAMWWGAGAHGGLLVTDNAKPFDMIKVSSDHPFRLPWVFGYLGQFMPTVFLTRLEADRDFPHPNLFGMRLDFKPTAHFQIALNRVFLFGGTGRKGLTASDWVKVFFASDSAEHSDSPTNGDQIASIDASYVYVNRISAIPFSGIKVYTEWGAEDSSGRTKTPTGRANLYGALVDGPLWLPGTALRVEWANTGRSARYGPSWYRHSIYTSGYTYKGRVIGHHMGPDSRDLFIKADYRASSALFALEAERVRSGIHSEDASRRDRLALDAVYSLASGADLSGSVGVETLKDSSGRQTNPTVSVGVEYLF